MKSVNFAVIGAGRIGRMYATNLCKYHRTANLKTIFDKYEKTEWIEKNNLQVDKVTSKLSDITQDEDIDAVIIASSTSSHIEYIKEFASAKKHIFCEKPISTKSSEIKSLQKYIEKNNVVFQVGYNRRFDPHFLDLQKKLQANAIGKIHYILITNRDPHRPPYAFIPKSGGLFFDFNSHDFDMLNYLTNEDIVQVYAMGKNLVDPKIGELGDIDTCTISLRLKSGILALINCCRETNYGYDQRLEVVGDKGTLYGGNVLNSTVVKSEKDGIFYENPLDDFIERFKQAYIYQVDAFIDTILYKKKSPLDIVAAYKVIKVAEAVQRSYELNRPVDID